MEPSIYKPSIYKGAGIYKTPGIYKGRGVYKVDTKKPNTPTIPYILDIDAFDIDTYKDGLVEYTSQGSGNVTKVDGKLRFGPNARFQCFAGQFTDIPNKIKIEIVCDFNLVNFQYVAALLCGLQAGTGSWWTNLGFYYYYQNLITENILAGYYSSSWDVFKRYAGVPFSLPIKLTFKVDYLANSIKCFFNDVQCCELVYNNSFNLNSFMGFLGVFPENTNGAYIDIISFKIEEDL